MNFDQPKNINEKTKIEQTPLREKFIKLGEDFLGDEIRFLDEETFLKIIEESEKEFELEKNKKENKKAVSYNEYTKKFKIGDEKKGFTAGNILNAIRLGQQFETDENLNKSEKGREVFKIIFEESLKKIIHKNIDKKLAEVLYENERLTNAARARAYKEFGDNYENKSFGIMAEKIIVGTLEEISLDRPDLELQISEVNVRQDVHNKIDFIITSTSKKRAVGINRSIGIQFTLNQSFHAIKTAQIEKAKKGMIDVDDIIYVEIKQEILSSSFSKWEKAGKPITGPWNFLPAEIRTQTIQNLLDGVLSQDKIDSLPKFKDVD